MEEKVSIHKVVFAGLDAVGKTSIYKSVIEDQDIGQLLDLGPTKGISRKTHDVGNDKIVFWDLGGQQTYRLEYFRDPRVFADTSILIYVLDIQDSERFDLSVEYLLQILMTIKNLDQAPIIYVLTHKFDPDKMDELRFNLLEAANILKEANKFPSLNVTKFATSIYSQNLDTVIENILQQIIPGFKNEMLSHKVSEEADQYTIEEEGEFDKTSIAGMEFKISNDESETTFEGELSKHLGMIRGWMGDKKENEDDNKEE